MRTRTLLKKLFMLTAIVFTWSCQRDEFTPRVDNTDELIVKYEIRGVDKNQSIATRTAGSAKENLVNSMHTLFFNPTTEKFVGLTASGVVDDAGAGTGSSRVVMPNGTDVNDHHKLLFIANFTVFADKGAEPTVEAYLFNLLQNKTLTWAKENVFGYAPNVAGLKSPFLMSAYLDKLAGTNIANIQLQRSVARVDIVNSAANFVLVSAELWNARRETTAADNTTYSSGSPSDYVHYSGNRVTTMSERITGAFYAFENMVMTPTNRDMQTTCLLVGGKYNGSNTITYYRINVCPANNQQLIKRNHLYTVNITNVTAPGKGDTDEAFNEEDLNLKYAVNDWEDTFDATYMFDKDGNGLAVSHRQVTFGDKGNIEVDIEVFRMTSTKNPIATDWSVGALDGTDAAEFASAKKVTDVNNKLITVKALSDNAGTEDRAATFTVEWGDIKLPINISQLSTNSQISAINAVPNWLWFDKPGSTKNVSLDLKGNFIGITQADIKTAVMYTDGSGWLTLNFVDIDAAGIANYTITTTTLTSTVDVSREANVKFTVIQGSNIMTCKVFVRQSTIDEAQETNNRQLAVNAYYRNVDLGVLSIAYTNFLGFPAGQTTINDIHFALNEKTELTYKMRFISSMSWKIVPSSNTYQNVSFSATEGIGSPGKSHTVDITSLVDAVNDPDLMETGWEGTFDLVFENGEKIPFAVHQKGCLAKVNDAALTAENGKIYYYGTISMFGKLWLDRNVATITTTATGPTIGAGVAQSTVENNGYCPKGFRLPSRADYNAIMPNMTGYTVKYSDNPQKTMTFPTGAPFENVYTYLTDDATYSSTYSSYRYFILGAKTGSAFMISSQVFGGFMTSTGSVVVDYLYYWISSNSVISYYGERFLTNAPASGTSHNRSSTTGFRKGFVRCVKQ